MATGASIPKAVANGIEDTRGAEGLGGGGPSEWREVTQEMVDRFAELIGDDQWIHVDVERAKRRKPVRRDGRHGKPDALPDRRPAPRSERMERLQAGRQLGLEQGQVSRPPSWWARGCACSMQDRRGLRRGRGWHQVVTRCTVEAEGTEKRRSAWPTSVGRVLVAAD